MQRSYYLDLARQGLHFPIGADLVLHEKPDHAAILRDGTRLGQVVEEAAQRFKTPLAFPVMDLMLEKVLLLRALGGISETDIPTWHFSTCPTPEQIARIHQRLQAAMDPRLQANVEAVRHVAQHSTRTGLLPIGMSIGPFSLMTKLLADPITPVFLAGTGLTAEDDPDVRFVETVLELATDVVLYSVGAQIAAGAQAIFIAEPAANKVFISPNQLEGANNIFERLPLRANRRIKELLDAHGVDLIFHCCGELVDEMIRGFCSLQPVILSLGSSRTLWRDAALVPPDIVLYGNLPSKKFYSDELISSAEVTRLGHELVARMQTTGHPFILGSECDVLCVPNCERQLMEKAMAIAGLNPDGAPQSGHGKLEPAKF